MCTFSLSKVISWNLNFDQNVHFWLRNGAPDAGQDQWTGGDKTWHACGISTPFQLLYIYHPHYATCIHPPSTLLYQTSTLPHFSTIQATLPPCTNHTLHYIYSNIQAILPNIPATLHLPSTLLHFSTNIPHFSTRSLLVALLHSPSYSTTIHQPHTTLGTPTKLFNQTSTLLHFSTNFPHFSTRSSSEALLHRQSYSTTNHTLHTTLNPPSTLFCQISTLLHFSTIQATLPPSTNHTLH